MNLRKPFAVAALLALFGGHSTLQDASKVLSEVSRTLGAADLKSIQYSASGFESMFGQSYLPNSDYPKFYVKYSRAIDYDKGLSREETVRTQFENPPRGAGGQPLYRESRAVTIVGDGSEWGDGAPVLTPHGFVKAALAAHPTMRATREGGKPMTVISFTMKGKYKVNGYVNAQNVIEKTETWTDNPYLGDMLIETTYSDYRDFGGVKFPAKIVQKQGGFSTFELTVSAAQPNAAIAIEPPAAPRPQGPVVTEKIADGVWYLRGTPEPNSQLVEFKDFTVIVESSVTEERALANVEAAKRLFPNKPVRYHVNSHHHRDHIAGLRAFVADGTTIITSAINKPFYEQVVMKNPHTLAPDRLTAHPAQAKFVWVNDKYVVTDLSRTLEIYSVPKAGHAANMLMSYLPKEKVLCITDIFNDFGEPRPNDPPPGIVSPYYAALGDRIKELKLDIQQLAPAHGRKPIPVDVLKKALEGTVQAPAVKPIAP